jgi:L-ascorbate metabolism protein UlaG (beta-lactamase superfamily)
MSSIELTYHGHSCFGISVGDTQLLIDPFLTGNELADIAADQVQADYILITHGHSDHVGDAVEIAKRTGAMVISNFEIATWMGSQGVERVHPLHIGGGYDFPFGRVKLTIAHHGSSLPDGSNGGNPAGLLLTLDGKKIYHAGDTALFYDMKLIGEAGLDLALLPMGDNFTMGPDDAIRAIKFLEPKLVIPMHYNTFDVIQQDARSFVTRVEDETSAACVLLKPGERYRL